MRPLLIAALFTLTACPPVSDEGESCQNSGDCEFQCSRVGECLSEDGGIEVRIRWTINGMSPSPNAPGVCGDISDFEVLFESSSARDSIAYFPIPCENGMVYYDQMPPRLLGVHLSGKSESGATLTSSFLPITSRSAELEFQLFQ